MKLTKFIVACFCILVFASDSLAQTSESSVSELQRVAKLLEKSAIDLGYEALKSHRPSDEWEAEEKKALLESHAYYQLLGKDFNGSCLLPDGVIDVTILFFKDAGLARRQIDEMKKQRSGGIDVKITKSAEEGYSLEEANGFYAVVIQDTKVILLEDRSRAQADIIKQLVVSITKGVH